MISLLKFGVNNHLASQHLHGIKILEPFWKKNVSKKLTQPSGSKNIHLSLQIFKTIMAPKLKKKKLLLLVFRAKTQDLSPLYWTHG